MIFKITLLVMGKGLMLTTHFLLYICQNGPLPLKYRVRPNCKKMKITHTQDGLSSANRSESDSASDQANSPAGAPSTSSPLPSPSTPVQSAHPHFPHISNPVNGSPMGSPNRQFTFGNKMRKSSLNGSSTSSGWWGKPDKANSRLPSYFPCQCHCSHFIVIIPITHVTFNIVEGGTFHPVAGVNLGKIA